MPKTIPCRPLWWRIPRAIVVPVLLVLALVFLFATAVWHSGGAQ